MCGLQHPEGSQQGSCHPSHLPPGFSHSSPTAAIPTVLPQPQTSQAPYSVRGLAWYVPGRFKMRWGFLSSLPATRNHHVLRLRALPPDPPPIPGQSLWPGLWVPHPQLPCHLYYLNLSTATSLPTQTSSAVCFPPLINTFPSFSCCRLRQLTAELLEKVTSTPCLLLHLPIAPQPKTHPQPHWMTAGFATIL